MLASPTYIILTNTIINIIVVIAYCGILLGFEIFDRHTVRADTIKVIAKPEKKGCPRLDQIRKLSVHNVAAKGPVWARSLVRKILGNEEFCLQIDAHSSFVADWDDKLKHEWAATGNEFGIISTVPPAVADKDSEETANTVPRQCSVQFQEVGLPVSHSFFFPRHNMTSHDVT